MVTLTIQDLLDFASVQQESNLYGFCLRLIQFWKHTEQLHLQCTTRSPTLENCLINYELHLNSLNFLSPAFICVTFIFMALYVQLHFLPHVCANTLTQLSFCLFCDWQKTKTSSEHKETAELAWFTRD